MAETEICRGTAVAITAAAGTEIEAAVAEAATVTVTTTVAATEDATVTMTAIMTEAVTVTTTATGDVTETATGIAAAAEVPKPDRFLLLQILVDAKKSLFHNRLFYMRLKARTC